MQVLTLPDGQRSITVFTSNGSAELMLLAQTATSGLAVQRDDFFATNGQTAFLLSLVPAQPTTALVFLNGVLQLFTVDYTFSSDPPGTLNWISTDVPLLVSGDIVTAYYGV